MTIHFRHSLYFLFTLFIFSGSSLSLFGHEIFQEVLKEKYGLRSFACKTCHETDDRTQRTVFADTIHEVLKEGNWSEKFAVAEAAGEEAVKEFDQLIAKEFAAALDEIGKQTVSVDDLLVSGLLVGVRIDPKMRETMDRFNDVNSVPVSLIGIFLEAAKDDSEPVNSQAKIAESNSSNSSESGLLSPTVGLINPWLAIEAVINEKPNSLDQPLGQNAPSQSQIWLRRLKPLFVKP